MKPPPFDYHPCRTVAEAVDVLDANPDGAKILAGGQSLVPMMNLRLANPEHLVDVNRVEGLDHITVDSSSVTIGATTRQYAVERSAEVHDALPVVRKALSYVGHTQIRNRGTVAGSICHADPAAEMPAVFLTLGGEVTAQSAGGTRTIPSEGFFDSYLTTTLTPTELVTEIKFNLPSGQHGWYFEEIARRHGDFAILGVVALTSVAADGRVSDARLTIFGGGATPLRMSSIEQMLVGVGLTDADEDFLERAALESAGQINPPDDIHGSADYRRYVAGTLVKRAITGSLKSAQVVV